nr:YheC/YheD family protein [Alteribacter salitolerans]
MGGTIFNTRPLYKGALDAILAKDKTLKEFIIEQRGVNTIGDIFIMVYRFKKIVVKPKAGVGGNGVLFIEKIGWNRFKVADYKNVRIAMSRILSTNQLISFMKERNLDSGRFIVQKWIQFKTYKGNSFDMRFHMQKNDEGWICSGIESRVAASGQQVTNLAKGGKPLSFEAVMESETDSDQLKDELTTICKTIGEAIDQAYPDDCFADIGMDIALDSAGKVWFIEANCRPLFKGFKKISPSSYQDICQRPIYYSTSKQGFIVAS